MSSIQSKGSQHNWGKGGVDMRPDFDRQPIVQNHSDTSNNMGVIESKASQRTEANMAVEQRPFDQDSVFRKEKRPSYDRPSTASSNFAKEGRDDSIIYQFSSDSQDGVDRYGSVASLVIKGKKALKSGGGTIAFQRNLAKEIPVLHGLDKGTIVTYNAEDEMQSVVLDTWTEELLKFLALKTITGDNTEPCQLLPGHAVGVAWKTLMVNPSYYSKVCLAMGNQNVFDHNPTDTAASRVQQKHKVKRYNATLRAYESYFEEQPASLYWNYHRKEQKEEDNVIASMMKQCGVDFAFIADPLAVNQKTREPAMSPNMPNH